MMFIFALLACGTTPPAQQSPPADLAAQEPVEQAAEPAPHAAAVEAYGAALQTLKTTVKTDSSAPEVATQAAALGTLSLPLLDAFSTTHPDCKAYLDAAKTILDVQQTASAETLELDYHQDGKLPKGPEHCHHAKDLVVHPASVVALTREPASQDRDNNMAQELLELGAHLNEVAREL